MFKVKSLDRYRFYRGLVLIVASPVTCPRSHEHLRAALGDEIEIDGQVYAIKATEIRLPATDIAVGEPIGILVGGEEE
jgi:hypothetical protein